MPLLGLLWIMPWFFILFAWTILLRRVFGDIFRNDVSGGGKALGPPLSFSPPSLGSSCI